jgi:two-component system, OmpR family, aerobic respiration control protein ArcA
MQGGSATVLVADDDPAVRLLCRVNLELEGYTVVEAGDASAIEQAMGEHAVDVVLLDVHLGTDDGRAVAAALRESWPEVALAFFTGSVSADALREGGEAVIPKPFSLEDLTGTVRRLAAR